MKPATFEPRLYIIMREDLWDMNPGKGMAQAAHAQALFSLAAHEYIDDLEKYCQWRGDGPDCIGFGVTLVLSATADEIDAIVQRVRYSGKVVDPTYPYRNWYGKCFTRKEVTCAWAFPVNDEEVEFLQLFPLHK